MKTNLLIKPLSFNIITLLPNAWNSQKYLDLLDLMDYGETAGLSADEAKEYCMLALTDYEPDEAAKIVLDYIFKERLNEGQKENLSHEMVDEKIWEEYSDIALHEELFNASQLLYDAFNGTFPHPEAVVFKVDISGITPEFLSLLKEQTEATLLRILVQGMPENTLINRLFKENLEEGNFGEASDIIWQIKMIEEKEATNVFEIISSLYWLHDLKHLQDFRAEINLDPQDDE